MTHRLTLILGLFTAALVGLPGSVLGQQSSDPPVGGWRAPGRGSASNADTTSHDGTPSTDVTTINFSDPARSTAKDSPNDDPEAGKISRKSSGTQRDPLVELTARMVDDNDVVAADSQELAPADIQPLDECCCPPRRPLIWVSGVEASFLWPDANSDDATFEFEDEARDIDVSHSSNWEGVDSMNLTPRIWLGIQGCCWGTNVRYWHLHSGDGTYDPTIDNDSDDWTHGDFDWNATPDIGFFSDSQLDAYTIDWELTRRFCVGNCQSQASLGVRYGSLELSDSVTGLAIDDDARHMAFARSDAYSRGTGLVMGLYGRKPLFPCSCVHWFYNARLSALWGPTCTSAETFSAVMVDGSSAGSVNSASTYVDDTLFIGEIQLGLEWNYPLQCLPANAFCRTAIEYQRWDGGPGSSEAGSFASFTDNNNYTSTGTTATSAASPQLDLVGLTIGTGLTW
jgi:hypothetical protein